MMKDEYARLYGECGDHPWAQTAAAILRRHGKETEARSGGDMFLYSTREGWFGRTVAEMLRLGLHHELLNDVEQLFSFLRKEYDETFGPVVSLDGPPDVSMERGHILTVCFDEDIGEVEDLKGLQLPQTFDVHDQNAALARAARLYSRECGWDFAPGSAGVWLIYCLLNEGGGSKELWSYSANIAGFVILHDRDDDNDYESFAHVWTAKGVRGKGVAQKLVEEARRRFPLKRAEKPFTELGRALFQKAWPEILAQP